MNTAAVTLVSLISYFGPTYVEPQTYLFYWLIGWVANARVWFGFDCPAYWGGEYQQCSHGMQSLISCL
jgi:hypothetical protein